MRSTLTFIFLLFLFPLSVFGQSEGTFSTTININASITPAIELVTVNSMTFNSVQPGQEEIYINPISDLNAGYMIAIGTPNADFRLDFLRSREITSVSGGPSLTFVYEISGNSIEDQNSSELIEDRNQNLVFNNEGRYYIWVGGRLDLRNAAPGAYEGDFTIEIDYI